MRMLHSLWDMVARAPEGAEGAAPEGAPGGGSETASFDDLKHFLSIDPFTPPAKEGAEGGGVEKPAVEAKAVVEPQPKPPAESEGTKDASPEPSDASAPVPEGQAAKEGAEDPLADIRSEVQKFLAKAPPAAPEASPSQPAQPKAEPEVKPQQATKYNFELPDSVVEAMESDDRGTRKQALNAIVNSLANKLATDFGGALSQVVQHLQAQVPQQAVTEVAKRQQFDRMKEEFYGEFPALGSIARGSKPFEDAIWSQIYGVAQNMKADWTPEFRKGVGQMLHVSLNLPLATSPTPSAAPVGKPPAKPKFTTGSGSGARPNGTGQSNEFMDVLGAGNF